MNLLAEIYEKNELDNDKKEEKISKLILNEFFKNFDDTFTYNGINSYLEKLLTLKNNFIYQNKKYIGLLFEILENRNYNMKLEVSYALKELCFSGNSNKVKKKFLNSPEIKQIKIKGRKSYISSKNYGKFYYIQANNYFKNDKILDYIYSKRLANRCHNNTFFLASIKPEWYSITSLCTSNFKGKFYHSYAYNPSDKYIIDLSSNLVMNKLEFDYLYEPEEISIILNKNMREELKIADSDENQDFSQHELLRIALYKQYLSEKKQEKILTLIK